VLDHLPVVGGVAGGEREQIEGTVPQALDAPALPLLEHEHVIVEHQPVVHARQEQQEREEPDRHGRPWATQDVCQAGHSRYPMPTKTWSTGS
jgi:hypothetical protein